ncbi:family 78 glycoside hydrolase catalytic domain [Leucobacter sp. NPDC058333]|uniref:family 78 glycoside hydrolase catalytic domain n=1 Tax=Leucobacter sp. NPDC058333 TaxID=3346450 RepID=UPI00364FAC5B
MTAPVRLTVDDHLLEEVPVGVALPVATTATPRLGWVVPLHRAGQRQTAWHVRASVSGDPRTAGDLWDSGTVETSQNVGVVWAGPPLRPHTHALWTVRTTDERGVVSDWATPVPLVTGPLSTTDWMGEWIAFPVTRAATTTFHTTTTIRRATLHFAGQGVLRVCIDGVPVNPHALDPTDSSLRRAVSRSYDATSFIDSAATTHSIAIVATLGHYCQVLDEPRVLAELHLELSDDTSRVIATSAEWRHLPSQIVSDEPFYIEEHDARLGLDCPISQASGVPVTLLAPDAIPAPVAEVVPDAGAAVRVVREVEAALIGAPLRPVVPGVRGGPDRADARVRVFDLGENLSGRVRVTLRGGAAGRRIVVAHGEKLDAHGRVSTMNIRLPSDRERERQILVWTTAGSTTAPEVISPWFAVHGFRYVEVRGITHEHVTVSAGALHSAVEQTGRFSSSEPLLDRLVDMAVRTQLNNTLGLPVDCPTREQAGWTGDAAASAEAAFAHLDLSSVYNNWLIDVALDARNGAVLGISPHVQDDHHMQPADPVWGAALTEIPWQQWWATGDAEPVRKLLPALRAWARWQLHTLEDGVVRNAEISFGADWLALEQTPPVMLQTTATIRSLRMLADLEEATGHVSAANNWRSRATEIVDAARRLLHDKNEAVWANDSQASIALALVTDLATDGERKRLGARLSRRVAERGNRLASGFAGTPAIVRALAEYNGGRDLLAAVRQSEQPGIGAMLVDGPGTFWETWWIDDDNIGVASLDHIGLGAPFAAWAWQFVAGLRAIEPGFRRFAVDPRLTDVVSAVSVQRMTRHGLIQIAWTASAGRFTCDVTVPVDTTAEIHPPGGGVIALDAGHHSVHRVIPAHPPSSSRDSSPSGQTGEHRVALAGAILATDDDLRPWRAVGAGITALLERQVVVCAPVFHEPLPAPTLAVTIDDFLPEIGRWVAQRQDPPLDLTAASFAFAHVDVDGPDLPGRAVRALLRLTSSDGTSVVGEMRPLPIAWNRVSIDLADWAGRSSIVSVEVGVLWRDETDPARGPFVPLPSGPQRLALRIGKIGWTSAPRTW